MIALGGSIEGFSSHALRLGSLWECVNPLFLIIYAIKMKIKLAKMQAFIIVIGFIFIWNILLVLKFGSYPILLGRIYDVLYAFILIRTLSLDVFFYYTEKIVTLLTKIGLFLWLPIIIYPDIRYFYENVSFEPHTPGTCQGTFGFFAFAAFGQEHEGIIIRNLGFCREPGVYSSILVFTLFIHLIRNKFVLFQKNFWPLVIGLISSQSTTGYMAFLVCIVAYLINSKNNYSSIYKYIIITLSILTFIYSPFMLNKLISVSDHDNFLNEERASYYAGDDSFYVPQRIEGLFWETMNIVNSPLLGYGDNSENSYVRSVLFPGVNISLSNGLLQIFAMMGIPLGLLFYFITIKSTSQIMKYYNARGIYMFFITLCAINVSYNFFMEPFFITISMYSIFSLENSKTINVRTWLSKYNKNHYAYV